MKLLDLFRNKKPVEENPEPAPVYNPLRKADILVFATTEDGTSKILHKGDILEDGTCLVTDNGKYYHTVVGCNDRLDGWNLITVEEAKKRGLSPCYICADEIWHRDRIPLD